MGECSKKRLPHEMEVKMEAGTAGLKNAMGDCSKNMIAALKKSAPGDKTRGGLCDLRINNPCRRPALRVQRVPAP